MVTVDTRKHAAPVTNLVVARQRHSRDALAALLWPEYDQVHARATLRRTLSTLNKALTGPWLEIDREHAGLNFNADIWVDVHEFRSYLAACRLHNHAPTETCSACLQPFSEAVALYDDDFLAGFCLRGSPSFYDCQFFQSSRLVPDLSRTPSR